MDGVGEAECGAPGAAEHKPVLNTQELPEFLNVGHQSLGVVVLQLGVRG